MSRGLGAIQRAALETLEERAILGGGDNHWYLALRLVAMGVAERIGRPPEECRRPSLELQESVRRAIRTLEKRGYLEVRTQMYCEALETWQLHCRLSVVYYSTLTREEWKAKVRARDAEELDDDADPIAALQAIVG